jgi:hypothetical protein
MSVCLSHNVCQVLEGTQHLPGGYSVQGLNPAGLPSSVSDICVRVTTHILNDDESLDFNQGSVRIILAQVSMLLYFWLLICFFNILHVRLY